MDNHERYLTLPQVQARVPKGRSTIYRWMNSGHFPRSLQIGPNSVVWRESDIENWMSSHMPTGPHPGA